MKKKLLSTLIIIAVISVSILIMIIPTFTSEHISRIALNKKLDLELILNDNKEVKIVFFGYSNCPDICLPRLSSISKYYSTLDENFKDNVGVEFIDISTPSDKTLPQRYAEFFNPTFKGIYLDKDVLREYTKAFNVFFSPSLFDRTEYEHTGNLYIVKKTKESKYLRYIYNSYPYNFKQINKDIKGLLNETY